MKTQKTNKLLYAKKPWNKTKKDSNRNDHQIVLKEIGENH